MWKNKQSTYIIKVKMYIFQPFEFLFFLELINVKLAAPLRDMQSFYGSTKGQ